MHALCRHGRHRTLPLHLFPAAPRRATYLQVYDRELSAVGLSLNAYSILRPADAADLLFAAALGFTWLATVPPTAGLIGKLFGPRCLGTLFGLTLLSHQIGGFFGAWRGGVALERLGNYQWMRYADMAVAAAAALVNLPIREQRALAAARPA